MIVLVFIFKLKKISWPLHIPKKTAIYNLYQNSLNDVNKNNLYPHQRHQVVHLVSHQIILSNS